MGRQGPGLRRRGQNWQISYYDEHGRRHFETVGPSYREALRARAQRLADTRVGKFGLPRPESKMTFEEFVEKHWFTEVAHAFKPSTLRSYRWMLRHHLLPAFADMRLQVITRPVAKKFISMKAAQQRWSYSKRHPNPDRPTLAPKTLMNIMGLLVSILEVAATEYNLIEGNPLRGILRRRNFPAGADRIRSKRPRVLEPEEFRRTLEELAPPTLQMVATSAFTGLRWGEQVALRIDEEVDFAKNKIHVTQALYQRIPQTPKSEQSVRSIDMCPTVRTIMLSVPRSKGFVFSPDGVRPLGNGSWLKRQWRQAQIRAGVKRPISWHDLRHQFVSLLIACGKHPKYISQQAGHSSAGFTLDRYGTLFETLPVTQAQWWDTLIWPEGIPEGRLRSWKKPVPLPAETTRPSTP